MAVRSPWAGVTSTLRSEHGAINVMSVIVLVVVLVAAGISAALLARTMRAAQHINAKAENIARTGSGINTSTDSVVQLNRTNETAASILRTAEPLSGQLDQIVSLAQEINTFAVSINESAGTINSTAGTINSTAGTINSTAGAIGNTARGINTAAAEILDVAQRIDRDVQLINERADTTIGLAQAIKGDTGNILGQAREGHQNAACIDNKVGAGPPDGHCVAR